MNLLTLFLNIGMMNQNPQLSLLVSFPFQYQSISNF